MKELYLLLSFLSGALELGSAFAAATGAPMSWRVFLLPLAYQAGNLLNRPEIFSSPRRVRAAALASALCAAALWRWDSGVLYAAAVVLASQTLQLARGGLKGGCSTTVKRFWRTLGFFVAPVVALSPVPALSVCAFLSAAVLMLRPAAGTPKAGGSTALTFTAMVFHQMHYFVYTYAAPVFVFHIACARMATVQAMWVASTLYTLSWWVYLSPEAMAESRTSDSRRVRHVFFLGHGFLALVLAVMSTAAFGMADSDSSVLLAVFGVAWMLTGLGGGTVFCIRNLSASDGHLSLPLAEDIGHAFGTAAAVGIARLCPVRTVTALAAAACAFVCVTLLLGWAASRKEG